MVLVETAAGDADDEDNNTLVDSFVCLFFIAFVTDLFDNEVDLVMGDAFTALLLFTAVTLVLLIIVLLLLLM